MRYAEQCKACGARHEHGPKDNDSLFKRRDVSACTECNAEGTRQEMEKVVWYCDVCGDELEENELHERMVHVIVKPPTWSGEVQVTCHPRCLDGAMGMVVEKFKEHCDEAQSRSLRPASWWERFWGK
jgi:hypothetical protein